MEKHNRVHFVYNIKQTSADQENINNSNFKCNEYKNAFNRKKMPMNMNICLIYN